MQGNGVRCLRCGRANRVGAKFCVGCGQALEIWRCPHTGDLISGPAGRFCEHYEGMLEAEGCVSAGALEGASASSESPTGEPGPVRAPGPTAQVRPSNSLSGIQTCPDCGGRVTSGARFCRTFSRTCGRALAAAPVVFRGGQPLRFRRVGWWAAGAALVVVLVGIGASLSLFGRQGRSAVAAGSAHSLALTDSGEVYAWGTNLESQLGLGHKVNRFIATWVPGLSRAKAIAAGYEHSFAITDSREVYAWGSNVMGELGLGDDRDRLTPTKVPGFSVAR